MLTNISVGLKRRDNTLTISPEFFEEVQQITNTRQVALIRLRFYPMMRNYIILKGFTTQPQGTRSFLLGTGCICIPKNQLNLFEGRVIGYETFIPGLPLLGFVGE